MDVNTGSAVDVRSSAAALGELSAINIRSNAARTVYGYQTQAASEKSQSEFDKFQADQAELAGKVGAGSSILGGLGDAGMTYSKFLQSGTINPGSVGRGAGMLYDTYYSTA